MEPKNVGITVKKKDDMSKWYSQVVVKSGLVDYTSVSGCFAYRPHGYAIWEKIVKEVDWRLKKLGVKNVYFPMFIPEKLLKKEEEHVQGFAPEVAWVTEVGNTKLDERLAIRPTSETIMYDSYSKWIRSWRDLPIRYNQWNNVVRWEFKHPTPLIRTREFLWCEGHSAFATSEEAEQEISEMMALWKDVTENLLAIKGLSGKKSDAEKFAGAISSYSIEYVLPNGKTAQGPDAHFDGQNFAKAFNIVFLDRNGKKEYAWQNTWAITTRMMGIMTMIHGDDRGLVLPPGIAPVQAVIIPIFFGDSKAEILKAAKKVKERLKGILTEVDARDEYTPGWKFNEWEMKGIPVRIELGPRDVKAGQAVVVRRDTGEKETVKISEVKQTVGKLLADIHDNLLRNSESFLRRSIVPAESFEDIRKAAESGKAAGGYFCGSVKCEKKVAETGAKSLCIELEGGQGNCVACGKSGNKAYFGRSY